jgi:DNA polymerase III delta prime subunit
MDENIMPLPNLQPTSLEELVLKPSTRKMLGWIICGKYPIAANGKSGLLLYGPPGTGKTAAAKLLPRLLDPELATRPRAKGSGLFHEFFSKSGIMQREWSCGAGGGGKNRGISLINEIEYAITNDFRGESGFAYIILNEVDELVDEAMGSLRSLMDRHQNVVWIFTTNHLNKLELAVTDRSYVLDFGAADASEWAKRCNQILVGVNRRVLSAEEFAPLYDASKGSARFIMSRLQAVLWNQEP